MGWAWRGWVGLAVALSWASPTEASPQASVGVTVGAAEDNVTEPQRGLDFRLGGRADALFGRSSARDMGVGPYVDLVTAGFHNSDVGGGLEWLIPALTDLPLTIAAGGFARNGDGRSWAPGVVGTLLVGARSYNYHSWYGLNAGVFVEGRWVPEAPASADLILGAQLDLELLVLPALLLWDAVTHGG